ncbi:MAG: hypothetical protein ACO3JL_10420, partial [Myxococcota bacterium]
MMAAMRSGMLLALVVVAGCSKPPIVVPGLEKSVVFELHFPELSATELGEIASFSTAFRDPDGVVLATGALSFDAQSRRAQWVEEPRPALSPTAQFTFHVSAYDVTGSPLPVGGAAGPIDLRSVDEDGVRLRAVVSRLDAFAEAKTGLEVARFGAIGAVVGDTSLLVTGGATA